MKRRGLWLYLLLLLLPLTPALARDAACPSPGDLPPRLAIGVQARVTSGAPNNLRAEPGLQAARIGQIPAGDVFRVLDGPRCADGYVWWQVNYDDVVGWTAEGDAAAGVYWLESLGSIPLQPEATPENTNEPPGCEKPPDVYDRVEVNGSTLNLRTLAMLDHAQEIYRAAGGTLDFRKGVMQGSYNPGGVTASFGTHDGGGAVDLSVRSLVNWDVLTDQIPLMLAALRTAGFAAWLRASDELYKGSPIHIHAIAIGDAELSEAAREQIDGTFGYLRGYNGLPQESGIPLPDSSGEMVICNWMVELGYHDLRGGK